ncbi:MAG TPA: methyltransferase domain-containing protein [Dehalococcoidia bacterium]|nr:methyltransferase domain-containing protein [Dehalococcoidia bacterium]
MGEQADPGYRDPDRSAGFEEMLRNLDHFDATDYVRRARRLMYRQLRPKPGMRLLDAGCGTGLDAAALASKVQPEGSVVGLDVSARFVVVARQRHGSIPGLQFVVASIEDTGFPDAYFDGACSMRTVQYLDDAMPALRELVRVTRPGGRVVVVEGGMSTVDLPDGELRRLSFGPRSGFGVTLYNLMRDVGLQRVRVSPAFGFSTGRVDPKIQEYARSVAASAVGEGSVDAIEAERWLRELDAVIESGRWFSADCMFVVAGTVPVRG